MKKLFLLLSSVLSFSLFLTAQTSTEVKNLRTENQLNPIGIDVKTPRFSWIISSSERGLKQAAYTITISTDKAGANSVWNSGKITSEKSINNLYAGSTLAPSTRYFWHVDVWDNNNRMISSTETAFFETGLLDSGWSGAQWIKTTALNQVGLPVKAPAKYTLEVDMTVVKNNANIIFSANDTRNMYMWQINTMDNATQPLLRRHIYTAGSAKTTDVLIGTFFSKADLLSIERHVKIDVDNNVIKTYIDNVLVDTYTDTSGALLLGKIGFRTYNSSTIDEVAQFDNVVLTNYQKNAVSGIVEPVVTFSENFEGEFNPFIGADTVKVAGNTKLKMIAVNSDLRVLQGIGIPMFRTKFSVDKTVKSAKIYASALGVYDLFINGSRVGTTNEAGKVQYDELKPGSTVYTKTVQYSTYDVTSLLKTGLNAIGAHVAGGWWQGPITNSVYGTKDLSFIAKMIIQYTDGTTKTVVTSPTSWVCSTSSPILMADIYHGETYDARIESNWKNPEFDDSGWLQTAQFTTFAGQIKAAVGPAVQVRSELGRKLAVITVYEGSKSNNQTYGTINTKSVTNGPSVVQLKKGQTVIYDFGQNIAGWVKFTAKAVAGTAMKVRFGEMLNDNGASSRGNDGPAESLYTANLRTAKATLRYFFKGRDIAETFNPNLTYFGFRYCEVTANQDVEIQSMEAEVVGSATEEGSSFTTSSPLVNQLYSNVLWGQRSNFLSIPSDCPQRDERLGWTGDTQIFSKAAAYNANVASFFHKWMGDLRDCQRADGAYTDVAPFTGFTYGNTGWADAGIIVPWNIYLMYDDASIIAENYSSMEKYMAYVATLAGSGYLYNGAGTKWGDWLATEGLDGRYIAVCYYAYTAQLMSKMSKALSVTSNDFYDQKRIAYDSLYKNIKAEFQTRYINTDGTIKMTSQTAYLLALKYDLYPTLSSKNIAIALLTQKIINNGNKLSTGFLGTGILNQTLSQYGATNTAYNLLLQRGYPSWLYSVDQGATTIWERWNSYTLATGFGSVSMNSFNHYAYGAVSEWMYRYMGGIEADEAAPGFKHIILQPSPDKRITLPTGQDKITSVDAKYTSSYGVIKSAWVMRADGNLIYTATIPANTTATLYLPINSISDVVYEGAVLAENAVGVTFVNKANGKAVYELKSGTYYFGLNVRNTTDVKTVNSKKKISVYPNPVHNELRIASEPADYCITNLIGTQIKRGKADKINVTDLNSGIYLIQVENQITKFIKE